MTLTLSDAAPAQTALVTTLIHAAFEPYRHTLIPPSGAHNETLETISAKMQRGGAVLAQIDGDWAGVVLYYPDADKGLMYLGRLAVHPDQRRRGVGRALTQAVEDKAPMAGLAGVWLGVRIALAGNQQLFESLGYRITSTEHHPGSPVPTLYTMEKRW